MTTHHRIIPAAAVALALAAGAAPAAARYDYLGAAQSPQVVAANQPRGTAPAAASYQYRGAAESPNVRARTQPLGQASNPSVPPATVVRVSPGNGSFDWGDAGIGVAGGVAISMLALGSALTLSQRRTRRDESATAVTS